MGSSSGEVDSLEISGVLRSRQPPRELNGGLQASGARNKAQDFEEAPLGSAEGRFLKLALLRLNRKPNPTPRIALRISSPVRKDADRSYLRQDWQSEEGIAASVYQPDPTELFLDTESALGRRYLRVMYTTTRIL